MNNQLLNLLLEKEFINMKDTSEINKLKNSEIIDFENFKINDKQIEERYVLQLIENQYNIKYYELERIYSLQSETSIIPKAFALKNLLVPIEEDNDAILIAIANPLNNVALEELQFLSNKKIDVCSSMKKQIIKCISEVYSNDTFKKAFNKLGSQVMETSQSELINDQNIKDAPAVEIVNIIINKAILNRASDIHFEPFEENTNVRIRVDGILSQITVLPKEVYQAVTARIKVTSGMDISQKLIPQDGKMSEDIDGNSYNFRIASVPTLYGEKIVIRILYRDNSVLKLDLLGFDSRSSNEIKSLLKRTSGMILVTGPTGSGKSTTLWSMVNEIDKYRNNVVTIEDPIEYRIDGINQINVDKKVGLSFSNILRSILRQDPDIIMIGEIRDEETAQIAVRASITGHLVLSTLHTNDSISSVTRLIDMNIKKYLLCDAISAIITQRLMRKICPDCKVSYKPNKVQKRELELDEQDVLYKSKGCSKCNYTGYRGRTVVYEILKIEDEHIREFKNEYDKNRILEISKKHGFIPFKQKAKQLVREGISSYEEYVRTVL